MHSTLARIAATALLVATPWIAFAGDDAVDVVRRAIHDLLHGDAAGRDAARTILEEHPDAAVPELLRVVTELRAAAAAPAPPTLLPRMNMVPVTEGDDVLQIYDVRDLLQGRLTEDTLLARLRAVAGDGAVVEVASGGAFVVKAPADGHAAATTFLDGLRAHTNLAYLFESSILTARAEAALGRDLSGLRLGDVALIDGLPGRLAEWLAAGDAQVLAAPTVLTLGDTLASVEIGREISFVEDFDLEVAQDSFIADPIVGSVFAGLRLDLRAWPAGDAYTLAVDATVSDVDAEFAVVSSNLGGAVAEPVRFQRPSTTRTSIGRTVPVADGGSFVLRLPDDPSGARRLLVVTLHRTSPLGGQDEPK